MNGFSRLGGALQEGFGARVLTPENSSAGNRRRNQMAGPNSGHHQDHAGPEFVCQAPEVKGWNVQRLEATRVFLHLRGAPVGNKTRAHNRFPRSQVEGAPILAQPVACCS